MASDIKLKVGDKIIQFGKAYRVCKIEKQKNKDGKVERIIFFKPYFKTNRDRGLICSIPENNLKQAKIRLPISQKEAKMILTKISKSIKGAIGVSDLNEIKDLLNENDQNKNVLALRRLWMEKNKPETSFTYGRRKIFEETIKIIAQEIALVLKIELEEAEEKIKEALKKSLK